MAKDIKQDALDYHAGPTPGKIAIEVTKPCETQQELSLAYTPGVAEPVREIAKDPEAAYLYTSKSNLVAVITDGTAVLGLGNVGALAGKPVMEGKGVLFKRFANVDVFDIEVDADTPAQFIETVSRIATTFGGINLEDIKAPECFEIEKTLIEKLDIPVFHDDQHGTAIIICAGMLNAIEIANKKLEDAKIVCLGAGAAGIASMRLLDDLGADHNKIFMVDRKGIIHNGRDDLNDYKKEFAVDTDLRTLEDAMRDADVFIGVSGPNLVSEEMLASMAANPVVFALSNPDPEISPEVAHTVRDDLIMATGRSDYPNQVNNVLGFPFIFRGALDVNARTINEEMKIAAAEALAALAKEDVPDEVAAAYHGARPSFGKDYIIPSPFDPRLIAYVPPYVAQAAMDTGVARKPIPDMAAYRAELARRLDPTAALIQRIQGAVIGQGRRIVFAEGEEPSVIRAAYAFQTQELGKAILVGREEATRANMRLVGVPEDAIEVVNARLSDRNADYSDFLYERVQRQGYLRRDVQRLVNNDRNVFSACMVKMGDADGMVTGVTRNYDAALRDVRLVVDEAPNERIMGMSIVLSGRQTYFIADTNVTEFPDSEALADIATQAAFTAQALGFTPRVAFLSYSSFGNPAGQRSEKIQRAVSILDQREAPFQYEGEMNADVALDPLHRMLYPFSRLKGPANVLVMPAIHSASIATKLLRAAGGATVLGPMLLGFEKSIQIARLGATVSEIVTLGALAAYDPEKHRFEAEEAGV